MTVTQRRPQGTGTGRAEAPCEPDRAQLGSPDPAASGLAGGSQVVVVAGVTAGVGASGLVVGVAGAALSASLPVRVVDAACPRRSALRELCDAQGRVRPARPGTGVITSTGAGLSVQYVHGGLDARVDEADPWQAGTPGGGAAVTVVDPGVSVEEALTLEVGRTWLTGPVVGDDAWLVLVVSPTVGCLRRAEAVLSAWSDAGLLPVAQVATLGPGRADPAACGQAGWFTGQALARAEQLAWHPGVYGRAYTPDALTGPLRGAGRAILTRMGGQAAHAVNAVAGRPRRGLIRRRSS